ncbi:hypothetical protein H2202_002809 [Exophiala xenobiotica]|nr:hypothetical protein H2202_002809 [Exophiala xenobiotica]KAK5192257.1 hypothetical protein LTR92_008204 [Exophiala xenobiotica]KAK5207915.1 hypothetical protein LTR41_006427 [Exophiala xenobiotica]KAK5322442.1 hypothetical protein LTR93_005645 [Exophiala xenobiotica]KAK5404075.1 hypothetical protein LTR06_010008 [Exophiala xenobiotica]
MADKQSRTQANACAHCDGPATKRCSGCSEGATFVEDAKPTWYCSTECQTEDWESHKPACERLKRTKSLYQAGDILNTLWPLLRSQTKQSTVDRVHVRVENTIDFFETLETTACFELNPLGGFPGDKRVTRAVLDVFPVTDRDVICSLGVVLRKLLAGVCSHIQTLEVKIKDPKLMVHCHQREDPEGAYYDFAVVNGLILINLRSRAFRLEDHEVPTHYIFRVRLKDSGEDFDIDIANAKYGHFDTVVPWDNYLSQRVGRVIRGNIATSYSATSMPRLAHLRRLIALSEFNTFRMKLLVEAWLETKGLGYATLVSLSKPRFEAELADLEAFATTGLLESYKAAVTCANLAADDHLIFERDQGELQRERRELMIENGVLQAAEDTPEAFLFTV